MKAVCLLFAVRHDVCGHSATAVFEKTLVEEFKVLVKERLHFRIEMYGIGLLANRNLPYQQRETLQALTDFTAFDKHEFRAHTPAYGFKFHFRCGTALSLLLGDGLLRKPLVIDALDALLNIRHVAAHHLRVGRKERCERHKGRTAFAARCGAFRHHRRLLEHLARKLVLYIKGAYAVDLVTEKVNAEGIFRRKAEDVENTSSKGKVAGLIDIVPAAESDFLQTVTERHKVVFLAGDHAKCHLVHLFLRCHALGHGFGRGYHIKRLVRAARKTRKHICTENLIGGVALSVLHRPPVT